MKTLTLNLLFVLILTACTTQKLGSKAEIATEYESSLADSILSYALDHEALFTLVDTLKPMSSVKFLQFPIAKDSSNQDGDIHVAKKDSIIYKIESYQKVCNALSQKDWLFAMVPFQRTEKNFRNIEIYVIRKSVFAKKIQQYQSFFGQWGFTPSTNPSVVLSVIEYESKWDRNRAYGYLFGYPSYAVDFFVEANKIQFADSAKKLVARNFFAIPVFAGNQGYFTYAMPKSYHPSNVDSSIYFHANLTLSKYKIIRNQYLTKEGLKAYALWRKMQ
jgi:hypothetical protein